MADDSMKKYSTKQEKMIASVLGGSVVAASGSRPTNPGDVKTDEWLAECKTHAEPGHNIFFDISVWRKICDEAMALHRKPVLVVDDGSQKESNTWCLCRGLNINRSTILNVDFPNAIRKNISGKHDKLIKFLNDSTKRYIGDFYIGGVYTAIWGDEEVVIMPLALFKEVCNK